jgi:hypothetical protein
LAAAPARTLALVLAFLEALKLAVALEQPLEPKPVPVLVQVGVLVVVLEETPAEVAAPVLVLELARKLVSAQVSVLKLAGVLAVARVLVLASPRVLPSVAALEAALAGVALLVPVLPWVVVSLEAPKLAVAPEEAQEGAAMPMLEQAAAAAAARVLVVVLQRVDPPMLLVEPRLARTLQLASRQEAEGTSATVLRPRSSKQEMATERIIISSQYARFKSFFLLLFFFVNA